jgi:hypothetical protein
MGAPGRARLRLNLPHSSRTTSTATSTATATSTSLDCDFHCDCDFHSGFHCGCHFSDETRFPSGFRRLSTQTFVPVLQSFGAGARAHDLPPRHRRKEWRRFSVMEASLLR